MNPSSVSLSLPLCHCSGSLVLLCAIHTESHAFMLAQFQMANCHMRALKHMLLITHEIRETGPLIGQGFYGKERQVKGVS